jgi:DNA mismatch repair ATPase MutS
VFELLCTVRTRAGEATLAAWLLAPAHVEEIVARQNAVRDLKERLKFREKLSVLGETASLGLHPEALSAWGERGPVFGALSTRIATTVLALLWILSLVGWGVWHLSAAALAMTVANLAWAHRIHTRLDQASGSLENAAADLEVLAGVLGLLEREHFSAPKLLEMQAAFKSDGIPPSAAIRKLVHLVEYVKARRNLILRPMEPVTFWSAQVVFAAERWQQQFGPQIRVWLAAVGEFEALSALSSYAFEHPEDVFPEFFGDAALFDAQALAHPLLPASKAVRNDVKLGDSLQLMILSGPNMAGKSTFIRTVGVNAVMAQCGAPVRASCLKLSRLSVAASICILDSLSGGMSRFYAEIHRIKLIFDLTQGSVPVLFLLDELLSGTNSHDRLEGTKFVVRGLMERGAVGLLSTHDLALTQIPETMGERTVNYHFEDRFEDNKLVFDHKLKPGIVQTSNALELMRSIGLGVDG